LFSCSLFLFSSQYLLIGNLPEIIAVILMLPNHRYPTRLVNTDRLYRLDLNFLGYTPSTDTTQNDIQNTFTVMAVLSTVERSAVIPNLSTIIPKTFSYLAQEDPTSTSGWVKTITDALTYDPSQTAASTNGKTNDAATKKIATGAIVTKSKSKTRAWPQYAIASRMDHLPLREVYKRALPAVGGYPDQAPENQSGNDAKENTYFLRIPIGTSTSALKSVEPLFSGFIFNYDNNLRFKCGEDDEIGSRLRLTINLIDTPGSAGSTDSTSTESAYTVLTADQASDFWDAVLKFGQSVVEQAVIPIALHYFGL
jgi:hypothetical protein